MGVRVIEGAARAAGFRFAVVAARFNARIVEGLLEGALTALRVAGAADSQITVIRVPGAFELPLAARRAAAGGEYDAVIALGAVIRGETAHFDVIAAECTRGLGAAALAAGRPVSFGVLTADTAAQAEARSAAGPGNKGAEAARAAVEMAGLLRAL